MSTEGHYCEGCWCDQEHGCVCGHCDERREQEGSVLDMLCWAHDEYQKILDQVDEYETDLDYIIADRSVFASFAKDTDEPTLMFALLDGKDIEPILWRRLRKHGTVHQRKEYTR